MKKELSFELALESDPETVVEFLMLPKMVGKRALSTQFNIVKATARNDVIFSIIRKPESVDIDLKMPEAMSKKDVEKAIRLIGDGMAAMLQAEAQKTTFH